METTSKQRKFFFFPPFSALSQRALVSPIRVLTAVIAPSTRPAHMQDDSSDAPTSFPSIPSVFYRFLIFINSLGCAQVAWLAHFFRELSSTPEKKEETTSVGWLCEIKLRGLTMAPAHPTFNFFLLCAFLGHADMRNGDSPAISEGAQQMPVHHGLSDSCGLSAGAKAERCTQ